MWHIMRETLKFTIKMKALSLFIQPHTISNLYDLLSSVDQTSYFEISLCFLSIQLYLGPMLFQTLMPFIVWIKQVKILYRKSYRFGTTQR